MSKILDISVSTSSNLPLWPNSSGLKLKSLSKIGKNTLVNESHLEMNLHVGTHIDAPLHFVKNGTSIDQAPPSLFVGSVFVAYLPKVKEITVKDLERVKFPKGIKRVLFKTSNSSLWGRGKKFKADYVGLTIEAAKWLVKKGVKLVGIDYLSIAKMSEAVKVHQILLGNGVYIIESLDLSKVSEGNYHLICLPLKITGSESAPARAILLKL